MSRLALLATVFGLLAIPASVHAATVSAATDAPAPTLAALEAAENAVADLWVRLPYTARNVMFVTRKADIFGGYD